MKHLVVAACCALAPIAAQAQNCGNAFTGCGSNLVLCTTYPCDTTPTFTTTHKWTVAGPGILTLSGTTFTITFDAEKIEYHLTWGTKPVGSSPTLSEMEILGVRRAQDMQDAGLPLK
jgi:hypothetical protein